MNTVLRDDLSTPHWTALAEGVLMIQQCADCMSYQWYSRDWCLACGGSDVGWAKVSGHGDLVTWTEACPPDGVITAVVRLREGVQVFGHLAAREGQHLRVGSAVTFSPSAGTQPRIQWKVDS